MPQLASDSTDEFLDEVFRDPKLRHGLTFFRHGERNRLKMRRNAEQRLEILCAKRDRWLRAKPEEIVRQLFLVWVLDTLKYPLKRVAVEWPIQMGEDAEKERSDIVIFSDDACTDPYIVFELKKPESEEGLEQLRSYLRWTGCFFGCWSNGHDPIFQLREEDPHTKKGPYKFRDISRLPKIGEHLAELSRRTEKAYVGWIRRFILFHEKRHPSSMGGPEVSKFLSALAMDRDVAGSRDGIDDVRRRQSVIGRGASFLASRPYCFLSVSRPGRIPLIWPVISLPLTLSQPVASGPVTWMSFPDMMPFQKPARPRWGPLIVSIVPFTCFPS